MRRLPKSAAISAAYGCRSFGPKPIPQTNSIITVVGQMGMRRLNAHTAAQLCIYLSVEAEPILGLNGKGFQLIIIFCPYGLRDFVLKFSTRCDNTGGIIKQPTIYTVAQ